MIWHWSTWPERHQGQVWVLIVIVLSDLEFQAVISLKGPVWMPLRLWRMMTLLTYSEPFKRECVDYSTSVQAGCCNREV